MRNILKRHSGTHSGTPFFGSKLAQNWLFLCGGENTKNDYYLKNEWYGRSNTAVYTDLTDLCKLLLFP